MPYDINVIFDKSKKGKSMYTVQPTNSRAPVPEEIINELADKSSVKEAVQQLKEEAKAKHEATK